MHTYTHIYIHPSGICMLAYTHREIHGHRHRHGQSIRDRDIDRDVDPNIDRAMDTDKSWT